MSAYSHEQLATPIHPEAAVAASQDPEVSPLSQSLRQGLGEWTVRAACSGEDSSIFFPEDFATKQDKQQAENSAKAICRECPVKNDCLEFALDNHKDLPIGIYGGYNPRERNRLLRSRKKR